MKQYLIVWFALTVSALSLCGPIAHPENNAAEPVCLAAEINVCEECEAWFITTEEPVEPEPPIVHFEEGDIVMLAKLLYQECGGVKSTTEQACVAWTVLNRVDESGLTIKEVVTAPNQFAYYDDRPIDGTLYRLAEDVLYRWNDEKNGGIDVGRVLPREYLWFSGDGEHNHFRNAYEGPFTTWNYTLDTPYES